MSKQEQRIVVGVDRSESSKAALRWAIRQAKLTGASVDVVTSWRYPTGYGLAPVADGSELDFEGDAKRALSEALGEVSGLEPEVRVRPLVAEGHAAEVLLRTARGADLLVVGSRGHGGFTSALVGSVSLYCVLPRTVRSWSCATGLREPAGRERKSRDVPRRSPGSQSHDSATGRRPHPRVRPSVMNVNVGINPNGCGLLLPQPLSLVPGRGHHYRASLAALMQAGARVEDLTIPTAPRPQTDHAELPA